MTEQEKREKRNAYMREYNKQNKEKKKENSKKWAEKNKDKVREASRKFKNNNKDKIKKESKEYYEKNKEKKKEYGKNYREENSDTLKEKKKIYYKENKDKWDVYNENKDKDVVNNRQKFRYKTDILYRLKNNISGAINKSLIKKGHTKNSRTTDILGCSIEDFKIYLESKFESWMKWENKGLYNGEFEYGWDIDHIEPLFPEGVERTEEDIIRLNHYTNLQPLCSYMNRYVKMNK
jgi:hypothetical protein